MGIGDVDVEAVEHEGRAYRVALPIAGHGSGVMLSEDGHYGGALRAELVF